MRPGEQGLDDKVAFKPLDKTAALNINGVGSRLQSIDFKAVQRVSAPPVSRIKSTAYTSPSAQEESSSLTRFNVYRRQVLE